MGTIFGVQIAEISRNLQIFLSETIGLSIEKSKLVKRERRMSGKIFIEICFKEVLAHGLLSTLRNFCQRAGKDYDILDFREESFNDRFNASSVACAEDILKRLLSEKFAKTMKMKFLEVFSHIFIEDSTSEKLNTKLADLFPGSGGSGNVAAIKLDLVIDLKQSEGIVFKVKKGTENDNLEVPEIISNSLYLRDLGYLKLPFLAKIHAQQAWYVSRIKSNNHLYTKCPQSGAFVALDLVEMTKGMGEGAEKDLEVYVGKKELLKTRLVVKKLPAAVAAERRRKLKSCPRTKRKNLSKQVLAYCDFSVVITNLSLAAFSGAEIYELYRIRWQVELIFKSWKSYLHLGKIAKKMKPDRVITLMYILLAIILLYHKLISIEYIYRWNEHKFELSIMKAYAIFQENKDLFIKAIEENTVSNYQKYLETVSNDLSIFGKKNVKGKNIQYSTLFKFD